MVADLRKWATVVRGNCIEGRWPPSRRSTRIRENHEGRGQSLVSSVEPGMRALRDAQVEHLHLEMLGLRHTELTKTQRRHLRPDEADQHGH